MKNTRRPTANRPEYFSIHNVGARTQPNGPIFAKQRIVCHEINAPRKVFHFEPRERALEPKGAPEDYTWSVIADNFFINVKSPWRKRIVAIQEDQIQSAGQTRAIIAGFDRATISRET